MSKLERYPKYKDSGVAWLGEIPEKWEVKKIKAVLKERKESNKPIKTTNILSLCMYRGVIPYSEKGNAGNKAKNDLTAYKLAYPGDIVLNSMNVIAGSVGLSKYFGAVSPVYYMLNPRSSLDKVEFFNDIFQSEGFQKSLAGLGNGILIKKSESTGKLNTIRMRIPMDKLNSVLIPYPTPKEQTKIANYLDQKTDQIDKAISLKEQMIERLKERRQILINDAVTKGLDKTVKMKDSGVEWIGEVPEEWEITKLGLCLMPVSIKNRADLPLLSVVREKGVVLRDVENKEANHNFIPDDLSNYKVVEKGQFAMNKMKAWQGSYGVSQYTGIVSPAYYVFKLRNIEPDFFHIAIRSKSTYVPFFIQASDGVRIGQWDLSKTRMKEIPFYVPPKNEQKEIVEYINESNFKIDEAIDLQQQQIEKLKEYKATIIDSVVTGKVRVS